MQVCLAPQLFLPVYLHENMGPSSPLATASLGPPAAALLRVLSLRLPISAPPTGLDECFFFNSLVVRLPYSWIFCQFWLFLFLNFFCSPFGCTRRHSMSTYTSILTGSSPGIQLYNTTSSLLPSPYGDPLYPFCLLSI